MNEYIISNLSNDLVYNVQVICKNKFGVSGLSNEESIIPSKSSSFQSVANVKLSDFEDSIENFYKNNYEREDINQMTFDIDKQISLFERETV